VIRFAFINVLISIKTVLVFRKILDLDVTAVVQQQPSSKPSFVSRSIRYELTARRNLYVYILLMRFVQRIQGSHFFSSSTRVAVRSFNVRV